MKKYLVLFVFLFFSSCATTGLFAQSVPVVLKVIWDPFLPTDFVDGVFLYLDTQPRIDVKQPNNEMSITVDVFGPHILQASAYNTDVSGNITESPKVEVNFKVVPPPKSPVKLRIVK